MKELIERWRISVSHSSQMPWQLVLISLIVIFPKVWTPIANLSQVHYRIAHRCRWSWRRCYSTINWVYTYIFSTWEVFVISSYSFGIAMTCGTVVQYTCHFSVKTITASWYTTSTRGTYIGTIRAIQLQNHNCTWRQPLK